MKGKEVEEEAGTERMRFERSSLNRREIVNLTIDYYLFFSMSLSMSILFFDPSFGSTNLQRPAGWHGGSQRCQVDVSALLPSLCLPQSLHNKRPNNQASKHTLSRTKCYHHSRENANVRMAVDAMKGNDPGHQAPSTRQGQRRLQKDKQTTYSPHPQLPTLSLHSFTTSLSFSAAISSFFHTIFSPFTIFQMYFSVHPLQMSSSQYTH